MSTNTRNRFSGRLVDFKPFPLPIDLCLAIFSRLTIPDVLHLRRTCRTMCEITRLPSLWHVLLRTQILGKGIPIPRLFGRPIDSLAGRELEQFACRALRSRRNWTSPSPVVTREVNISPSSDRVSTNHAVHFLPGRSHRWLLSVTENASSVARKQIIHCWDVQAPRPALVATYRTRDMVSFAVNTDNPSPAVLAVQLRTNEGPCIKLLTINFSTRDPEAAFVEVGTIQRDYRDLVLFSGSTIIAQEHSGRLILWNYRAPNAEAELRGNPTPEKCHAAVLFEECALVFRSSFLEIYPLAPYRAAQSGRGVLYPVVQHRWPWRIFRVCIARQSAWPAPPAYPDINVIIRFADQFNPWPTNTLHRCVIRPNGGYSRSNDVSANNLPYFVSPSFLPSIAAPVGLFAKWDMTLGQHGTTLWIDGHTQDYFGEAVQSQRLAGERFWAAADDRGSLMTHGTASRMASTVYGLSERGHWRHLAIDEHEGRIAIGTATGMISLFEYSS